MTGAILRDRSITHAGGVEEIDLAYLRVDIIERDENRRARYHPEQYHGAPVETPRNWYLDAACRDMDMNLFFTVGRPNVKAVEACARCPVREACLAQAMVDDATYKEAFGYRGGMPPIDRQRVKHGCDPERIKEKAAEIGARFLAECGGAESDTDLLHRLAGEYGLWPADLKRTLARHAS